MPGPSSTPAPRVHARSNASSSPRFSFSSNSRLSFLLVVVVLALVAIGLITVYSATLTTTRYSFSRQVMGVGIGVVLAAAIFLFDYRRLSDWLIPLVVIDVGLMLLPMTPLGIEVNGARSWVSLGGFQFQPSEFAKPVTILMMAAAVSRYEGDLTKGIEYLKMLGLLFVPFALLVREDLGSALVILMIGFFILVVGGAGRRLIVVTIMALAVAVAALLGINSLLSTWTGGETQIIKPYQMSRLLVFIDQDNPDYADDAYNLNQAKIAVGSGGIAGKGFGNATQSAGGFLPEYATDFIFCVYAEQFGFLGAFVLLALYLALLAVSLNIAFKSSDLFGSLIVAGIMGMWLFQIVENIGMDLGLMPITGIPLPFMSYGSSFMLTNFLCVGLLLSIWARRGDLNTHATSGKGVQLNV